MPREKLMGLSLRNCLLVGGASWLAMLFVTGCGAPNATQLQAHSTLQAAPLDALPHTDLPATEVGPYVARKLFDLQDDRIDESSGAGASRRYPGMLWTHNDSGDIARLFLVALEGANAGKTIAEVRLEGAGAVDWEDMAVAGSAGDAWVYVGDTGDNLHKRTEVVVYRFREPELAPDKTMQSAAVKWEKMTLTYPDGAHDAETLIATKDDDLLIVSKLATGESVIYKSPHTFADDTRQELVEVGEYKFDATGARSRMATGGDLSPNGRHLVLRTYTKAYEWDLPVDADWSKVWPGTPKSWTLPVTIQGESICYAGDGQKMYITTEKVPSPVFELRPRS
jgi:hypothetical protein